MRFKAQFQNWHTLTLQLISQSKSHGPALYQEWRWIYSTFTMSNCKFTLTKGIDIGRNEELRITTQSTTDCILLKYILNFQCPIFFVPAPLFSLINHIKDFFYILRLFKELALILLINSNQFLVFFSFFNIYF